MSPRKAHDESMAHAITHGPLSEDTSPLDELAGQTRLAQLSAKERERPDAPPADLEGERGFPRHIHQGADPGVGVPPSQPAVARVRPRHEVGGTVNFVMPGPEGRDGKPRLRTARVVGAYRRDELSLDVDVDPDEDGLPTPYRYPRVVKGEPHQPGTWH